MNDRKALGIIRVLFYVEENMLITCKNTCCKYYYQLKKGQHCPAEEGCPGYTTNKRKANSKIPKCKECEYCKRITTNDGKEYHYACTYMNRNKVILFAEKRKCDCRVM